MGRSRALVVAFAVAGLFLVAGVTYLASTLVSQPIGLTSEPATLGKSLAPTTTRSTTTTARPPVTTTVTTTTTVPATTPTVPPTTTTTLPATTLPSGDADDSGGPGHDGDSDDD